MAIAKMTRISALKTFLNDGATNKVENTEIMAFWKTLTEAEKQEFSEGAAKALGVELQEANKQ